MTILVNRLDKRVAVYKPGKSLGMGDSEPPTKVCDTWAAIEPLRGNEFFASFAEQAQVTTRIRIRYRTDVERTMFVQYKGVDYEIMYIIHPSTARKELQLMCKEMQ